MGEKIALENELKLMKIELMKKWKIILEKYLYSKKYPVRILTFTFKKSHNRIIVSVFYIIIIS